MAALVVAAVLAWPNFIGGPEASPSPAPASGTAVSSRDPGPTESGPTSTELPSTPAPDEPYVEPNIVDRAGVPAELYDKYWIELGQVGQVGTTARMVLPPNEAVLAAGADRVASYALDSNYEPVVGLNGVSITVRDLRSGATLRTFDTPISVLDGLMVGSRLFWRGLDTDQIIDGGVWVIDLADPSSSPQEIIPATNLSAVYGPHAMRGLLKLTDRGRLVITRVGGDTSRATDVIDVASLAQRPSLNGIFAVEIIDGVAIAAPVHGDGGTPDRPNRLRLIDIVTGAEIGPGIEAELVKATVVGDGEVYVQYSPNASDSIVAAIDVETGRARELRSTPGGSETLDLSRALSGSDLLALVPASGAELDSGGRVRLPVSLLDPVTGGLELDAFVIGSP